MLCVKNRQVGYTLVIGHRQLYFKKEENNYLTSQLNEVSKNNI